MIQEIAAVVGGILGAGGAIRQGNANAGVANYNATIADQNAQLMDQQGAEAERRSLVNSRKIIGMGEADAGASGITGGTFQAILRNSAAQGELNALTIKNNADIKATAFRNEAGLDRYRAGNATTTGNINAATSLLGTVSGQYRGGSSIGNGDDSAEGN